MQTRDIVRIARQRAGLTQEQLALRSGHPRESIARWETGAREPSLKTLQSVAEAAGLELVVSLAESDDSLRPLVTDQLALEPEERLSVLLPAQQAAAARKALDWIGRQRLPMIVVGAVAAALQGAPQRPGDGRVEVVADDLPTLVERLGESAQPVNSDERFAASDRRWPWVLPDGGIVVLASALPGSTDYRDLRRAARELKVAGKPITVAHPRDLLRLADASSRDSERARVPGLRVLLDELRARNQA